MAYIDRELMFKKIREKAMTKFDWSEQIDVDDFEAVIKELPTADVVEVKHGEWIPVQYTYFGLKRYECSECKDDKYWQKRYLEHKEKYCPNCGAKMDGKEINVPTNGRSDT